MPRPKTLGSLVEQRGDTVTIRGKGYSLPRAEEDWLMSMGAASVAHGPGEAVIKFGTAAQAREAWGWMFGNGRANVDSMTPPAHFVGEPMDEMAAAVAEEVALSGAAKGKKKK